MLALAASLAAPQVALAQQNPFEAGETNIAVLLGQGFEIKAAFQSPNGLRLILQNGETVYNCDGRRIGGDKPYLDVGPLKGTDVNPQSLCFPVGFK